MNEISEVAIKALDSKLVEKAYDDGISPALTEIGKIGSDIGKTARLILAPFQLAASLQDRLEHFLANLNKRVPEERRINIPTEIAGPALDSMRYLETQSTLWKMFEELLIKSADKNSISVVHPSFVHIIKQLTRDEAYMLYKLTSGDFEIVDTLQLNKALNRFENRKIESSTVPEDKLTNPASLDIFYSHLESLSLASWPVFKETPIYVGSTQTGIRRHSKIQLTEFGKMFVAACIPKEGIADVT
jgi:hypothetical protein